TTINSHQPNSSFETQPVTVTYSVVSTNGGPTPTGNVIVSISGGTETCTATVADGQCQLVPTQAAGVRTITAAYQGTLDSNSSTPIGGSHSVNACTGNPIVTTSADSGAGSLRQAIVDACPNPEGNTITFDMNPAHPQHVTSPITLTSGE